MMSLKITRSSTQYHAATIASKANKVLPHPLVEDDSILAASLFVHVQQDLVPPRAGQGTFQALMFFQPLQELCLGQSLQQPLS